MKKVAIIQPNYIPWKGYFDLIASVDVFIFLDDVQHTVRDWRTRNKIKTAAGTSSWLSVPTLGGRHQLIHEVAIDQSQDWARKHTEAIRHSYKKTPYFADYFGPFSEALARPWTKLVELDIQLTRQLAGWLGLSTEFLRASELGASGTKDERLIELVQRVGGTHYLSGPAARDYIRPERFLEANIELAYHSYDGYPSYPQISEPFDPFVTVLDLLFAVGASAPDYIWGKLRTRSA